MLNLLPQPLKLLLESFLQKIGLNERQATIITALIFLVSCGVYYIGYLHGNSQKTLGAHSEVNTRQSNTPEQNENPKSTTIGESAIQFDQQDWDLRRFYRDKDEYYCSFDSNQSYNFVWYKQEKPLLSTFFIKFQTKPSSVISEAEASEIIIKLGSKDKDEYSEFYLPVRIKETVQYKQRDALEKNLAFQTGKALSTPIKSDEPIELITNIKVAEKNHIQTDFRVTYLSINKGISLTDPFSYQTFVVDETNPRDLTTQFGFGIDNKSCFKIIKYCFAQICT